MRAAAVIAALFMALTVGAMILPTGECMETAIAFQPTDIAAAILALALAGLGAAVWNSITGKVICVIGVGISFAGLSANEGIRLPADGSLSAMSAAPR